MRPGADPDVVQPAAVDTPASPRARVDGAASPILVALGAVVVGFVLGLAWQGQAWSQLALAAGAGLAGLVAVGWRARAAARRRAIELDSERLQRHRLERRARQLDEAEQLVSVGSFDWSPVSGELHWSEQHYRQWGLQPGAVQPSLEVFVAGLHPDDAPRVQDELQQALRGERRYDCRHRVRRPDGTVLHVHARGEVFFDAQGQPQRMIGAVLDVTERVEAESALRLQGFVLDAMPDAVSVVDAGSQRYRLVNRGWLDVNGRTREQAVGRSIDELFPQAISPARRQALAECLTQGKVATVRGPSPSSGTRGRTIETRFVPFHDPHLDWNGAAMVSRDVTEDDRVRQDLAHSVDNLSLTLNTIGDAIFATDAGDPDEPVLFANDQVRQLWRIPPDQADPLTARVILDHARLLFADPDAELARIGAIVAGHADAEHRLDLTDGRVILRRCRRTQLDGREVRVWVFRDITAESRAVRSLAAAEAQQRTLLAAFPGFIWVLDDRHRVVYLNPAAAAVYLPHVHPPLAPAHQVFGAAVYERLQASVARALDGESLSIDWHRPSRSGRTPEHLLIRMAPGTGPEGQRLCYAFGIDISSLKQAEAALLAAKNEAERANLAKTRFLSSMSHELRTPLNAVIGFSQVLELDTERNLSPRQLRQLGDIRRAGQHLLTLINDLLDLARIEAGHTQLTLLPLSLADLADECLQLVRPMARPGLQLQRRPSPPAARVLGDRTRLKQVLINLLSNAVKYNPQGHRVELAWRADDDGRGWRVEVHDDGPGIEADAQGRLFQPFERLDAEQRGDVVGTGIGLALSRTLVQLMGGRIGVDSTPGLGSCFWLTLQAPAAPAAAAVRGAAHVLYVDDNPVNLALMEGLFEDFQGWTLATCDRPEAALVRIRTEPFQLLLVDLQMPGLDGFELFAQVRADAATRTLPMIAVSADVSPETAERCRRAGFADFVPKPVDASQLQHAAQRALAAAVAPGPPSS